MTTIKTKQRKPVGKSATHHKMLRRYFGGLLVADSKRELRVFVKDSDIAIAKPKDPTCCVFAEACKRTYGSHNVVFFRSVAYVDLPDARNNLRIERFQMRAEAKRQVANFDKTNKADPGGFILHPPSKSYCLDYKLQNSRERNRQHPMKKSNKKIVVPSELSEVRNGKGLVKFLGGPKEKWVRDN